MKIVASLFSIVLFTACNFNTRADYSAMAENTDYPAISILQEHPGKKLMENNCYVCHGPKSSEETIMGPPMIALKTRYISKTTSKEEFIEAMVEWIKNPSEEKSKMPEAVEKYGLMPNQFFPESTIREIADYMFVGEIEKPDWYKE